MTDYDIRPVAVDERRAASDTLRVALLSGAVNDEHFATLQASWDESDTFAAWDGDRCVGHVAAFRFDSTVPGGARVPTAGVTRVGVLPTHTRRGLLTQMMHRLLRDAHEQGNVLSALHASETSIYRRFGFGIATDSASAVITTRYTKPWRSNALPGSMRLLPHTQVLAVVPDLYERVARWHVGSISRPAWMWPRILKDASQPTAEPYGKGSFVTVHSDPSGADDGFVSYEVDWDETFAKTPTGIGKVHDLWGASPAVELELWRYLIDIDLITTWKAEPRPVDEPVRRAMHDSRAYEAVQRFDDQWIRILDVDAALTARAYGTHQDSVNVRVHDPMFATNTGTWTISATGADRNDGPADIEVDIGTLSAAYLGAVSWHDLDAIGAVTASDELLTRLDTLFAVHPSPFCGTGY
ncbi:MAG TPA: GNAT family N-acetyltransferase [Ilumatobacteraceae bacterium]|nr:GNAT family N-acetyltransferase [Ilumatobacteraceae bacterium]